MPRARGDRPERQSRRPGQRPVAPRSRGYPIDLETKEKLRYAPQEYIDAFTEKVKVRGHDGVLLALPDGSQEIDAFEPTQVKSAIGNNGQFDPGDANMVAPRSRGWTAGQRSESPDTTRTNVQP